MVEFWVDANVFIEAKNKYYAFDIAPGFWEGVKDGVRSGRVRSPMKVYDEIAKGKDELATWAGAAKAALAAFFAFQDQAVSQRYTALADQISANNAYCSGSVAKFLGGADLWVVSFAAERGGAVVTQETAAPANSRQVKIPNICQRCRLQSINTFEMIRRLGIRLG